jgi:hypothetical protein
LAFPHAITLQLLENVYLRNLCYMTLEASSPKISEKPDPKRTSGARVAFSTSSQPIFAAEPQAVPA